MTSTERETVHDGESIGQEMENSSPTINHSEDKKDDPNQEIKSTSEHSHVEEENKVTNGSVAGDDENRTKGHDDNQNDNPSANSNQVNVDIDGDQQQVNLKLTLTEILTDQPLITPIYRLLSKRTGRLRIQRIIYFMGTFSIAHSFLMLISVLPSTGLVDSFSSHLDYMKFTLFLNDLTLFTMLNGILTLDPPFQMLNYIWTMVYSPTNDSPSKATIEIKQWILSNISFIRKRLYLLIIASTIIYLQLMVTIGLDSASNLSIITRIVDIIHVTIDLIGLLVVFLLVYQFLIITIFAQSIFRDISDSFKEDKKILPWNLSPSLTSSSSINTLKTEEMILSRRNRYCGIIEFTRTANNHWKNFLAIFILSNFIPAVFQLHFILNKQLDEQQLVELLHRFLINIIITYIIIVNSKRVNHFSREFYDDLYQLTLKGNNEPTRLEALLFLDRVAHDNIGFTMGDSFLITSNLMAILFASLIVLVFILPSI